MGIAHFIAALVVLFLIAGFLVFAFRQGMAVRPSGKSSRLWWQSMPPDTDSFEWPLESNPPPPRSDNLPGGRRILGFKLADIPALIVFIFVVSGFAIWLLGHPDYKLH
jgi:hypothetical protein